MIVSTRGIVIRTLNYRETSKIVEIFTESDGLVALIAKGYRKQTKQLGILEPLNIVFVSFYKKKSQELHLLSKAETLSSYYKLLNSSEKLFVGLTILNFIKETQVFENPNEPLFRLTENCIEKLKEDNINSLIILVYFLVRLTQDLGLDVIEKLEPWKNKEFKYLTFNSINGEFQADFSFEQFPKISRKTVDLFFTIDDFELENLDKIQIVSLKIQEIINFFAEYLSFYLGKSVKINTLDIFNYDF
ncbi:MAG: DNA repair protein RecO [Candidatus Kapaibacteriota bacterium]